MKILALSDTHLRFKSTDLPLADALIHAGDATMFGERREYKALEEWFREVAPLFPSGVFFIPGNHDRNTRYIHEYIKSAKVIINQNFSIEKSYRLMGREFTRIVKCWGSPFTPYIDDRWNFANFPGTPQGKECWSLIPENIDILVTHGPGKVLANQWGDEDLQDRLSNMSCVGTAPRVHVFGHIHEDNGIAVNCGILSCNVSVCDESYDAINAGTMLTSDKFGVWRANQLPVTT